MTLPTECVWVATTRRGGGVSSHVWCREVVRGWRVDLQVWWVGGRAGQGRAVEGRGGEGKGRIRGREERGYPTMWPIPWFMRYTYPPPPPLTDRRLWKFSHNFVCRRYQEDVMSNAKCSLSDNPWFIVHMFEYFRGGGGCPCTVGSNFKKFEPVWGHVQWGPSCKSFLGGEFKVE